MIFDACAAAFLRCQNSRLALILGRRRCRGSTDQGRGIIPLQNCCEFPTATSYFRARASVPSAPMRNTVMPAGKVIPSLRSIGIMLVATRRRPLESMKKGATARRIRRCAGLALVRRCFDRPRTRRGYLRRLGKLLCRLLAPERFGWSGRRICHWHAHGSPRRLGSLLSWGWTKFL